VCTIGEQENIKGCQFFKDDLRGPAEIVVTDNVVTCRNEGIYIKLSIFSFSSNSNLLDEKLYCTFTIENKLFKKFLAAQFLCQQKT
jgi:hypothetical protein